MVRQVCVGHVIPTQEVRVQQVGETQPTVAQQRVLDAAAACFGERGFHGTTTRDIAKQAQLSPAVLYVHYPTKEDVLYEISRAGHVAALEVLRAAAARGSTPTEQLGELAQDFALWHARSHAVARVVNYELGALSPAHHEQIALLRRQMEQVTREVLEAGLDSGEFAVANTSLTALAVLSLGVDVGRWFKTTGTWQPEDVAKHYRELALRMVLAH
ncbi:MAG: TetR/AcrR family transcriptional regulator [Intrasporangium sp.]|uniref:TetR/AcrR family transcriptional regulator n=1 Tax=Intrasporangium sp. TaxID=1925024 RepID=UPI002647886A|nr:TetR/AcrR family transcriptional regulator [Intrasporangium sp.]MDN5795743.1 TetR/AcrR family transcriptional regulator [Intrasporangium sp.]